MSFHALNQFVTPSRRRRVEALARSLAVVGDEPLAGLSGALSPLRELLGMRTACAYRVVPTHGGWDLDMWRVDGDVAEPLSSTYAALLRTQPSNIAMYDPARPEPRQRNRVWRPRANLEAWLETAAGRAASAAGLGDADEMRVLLCDGPALVAWVGGYRNRRFGRVDFAILRALIPALLNRARLERDIGEADTTRAALDAVMDTLAAPTFIAFDNGRVVHTNRAGRALLRQSRTDTEAWLIEVLQGGPGGRVHEVKTRGLPALKLVTMTERGPNLGPSVAEAARRWRLTPRQGEVLRLVVAGLRNQTIATQLGISLRTAELHVSALLTKAGAASRAELAGLVFAGR